MHLRPLCGAILCFGLTAAMAPAADESVEPPLELTIVVNGQEQPISFNQPVTIKGDYKNPSITIKPAPTRHFPYGGIAFNYPVHFAFEAEIGQPNYKQWSLDGQNVVIMYFSMGIEFTPETYVAQMVRQFGEDKSVVTPTERRLGKHTLKGQRVRITVGDSAVIVQEGLALPAPAGTSRILVLQDTPAADGSTSAEMTEVLKLLGESLNIADATP